MKRYNLLLADADGTVLDFKASEAVAIVEAARAVDVALGAADSAAYTRINEAVWKAFERGEVAQERLRTLRFERFFEHIGIAADASAMAEAFVDALSRQADEIDGARAFLAEASRRVPVVIVTNGIASVQRARFAISPLRQYIACHVISGEIGCAKPDPRMIEAGLAAGGGVPAGRALMLGDSLTSDIAAAVSAGVDSCWFNPDGRANDAPHRPTWEIRRLDEALQWL